MSSLNRLARLSELAAPSLSPDEAIRLALPRLAEGLGASDVFLVYGETGFRSFGAGGDLALSDTALWLVHRDLTSRLQPCAFDIDGGHVLDFRQALSRRANDAVAALIPMPVNAGEMLIAKGPWRRGFSRARLAFLETALPTVALLMERRLDLWRADRQRQHVSALANVTRVMSSSEDLEVVLTSIAGTIATTVAGIDYVSIDLVGEDGSVQLRCINSIKPNIEALAEQWKRGASRPDPVRDMALQTRQPVILPDAQNDPRVPETGRLFFTRTLLRSAAVFPLLTRDEVVGVLSVVSHRPVELSATEAELLEGLAAQVATAVKGIQLYQELAESRRQLEQLNEQLSQSMEIQHHLARTDPLTGIPNRRFIDETIAAECARARRYGHPLSVVMADLDRLKAVNDTRGHSAGDEAIKFTASLARESCRAVDGVGRYGGDEFVFVLPATELGQATVFAERFRERFEIDRAGRLALDQPLTVSLGVAQWNSTTMTSPDCLVKRVDGALYVAKSQGRNRVAVDDADRAAA
jgi:diguanylate cyclase (GGDEF)-like protein